MNDMTSEIANLDEDEPDFEYDRIDSPLSILPDLTIYGIDEIDRGICEDTYENRSIMRRNRIFWVPVYNQDGQISENRIQALTKEMMEAKAEIALSDKKSILFDPRKKNSDYLTGLELLMADDDRIAPAWVIAATRAYVQIEKKREETGKDVNPRLVSAPGRCRHIKVNGTRCQFWHGGRAKEDGLCRVHLGARGHEINTAEKTRNRLMSATLAAAEKLEQMMETADSEQVQLRAAEQILNRTGFREGFDINAEVQVEHRNSADLITERLTKMRAIAAKKAAMQAEADEQADQAQNASEEDIIDAEVIDDANGH